MAACVCAIACGSRIDAHPLGNFTINHLSELSLGRQKVSLRYILDMAEIPTYQTMRELTPDGRMNRAQLAAWAASEARDVRSQLRLDVDGRSVALEPVSAAARTRPGAGGLPTLYLAASYRAAVDVRGTHAVRYSDGTFAGRLGWKDVVVAPNTEPTRELTAYPNALLGSPRALTAVIIRPSANGAAVVSAIDDASAAGFAAPAAPSAVRSNQLSDMLARGTGDWAFVLLTFAVAIALGALHALEPGHGKTLLAISLVGARATVGQAAILAGALTVAHTIGVIALGFAIESFKGAFVPEAVYPWITLVSGIAIAFIGARAVERQLRDRRPFAHAHVHVHPHAHAHEHPHVHGGTEDGAHAHVHPAHDDLEHARLHAIPGTAPLRFGPTVWAAMSGGVAPCPAALVVLLAAAALNEVTYGILLIIAFSAGLAATLTGLGIAVVRGAGWLRDRPHFSAVAAKGPMLSAIAISAIGAVMVGQGFAQQGVAVSALPITALTALAIAGYAFSHPFAHRAHEAT